LWNTGYAAYLVLVDHENIFAPKTLLRGFTIEPFDVPLWFIFALLLFLLPAPLLARVKNKGLACGIFLAALCVAHYFPTSILPQDCRAWFAQWFGYWPVYFFGFLLARLCPQAITQGRYYRKWLSLLAAVYLVSHVFSLPWLRQLRAVYAGLWPVQTLAEFAPLVALWLLVDSRVFQKPLPYPVTISFLVYAGHMAGSRLAGLVMRPLLLDVLGDVVWCGWQAVLWRCWFGVQAYLLVLLGSLLASRILPPKVYALFSGGRVPPRTQKDRV
jgi:surface polysaccharide O-acyltransferase-like enzyme